MTTKRLRDLYHLVKNRRLYNPAMPKESRPCKRFSKRFVLNARLLAHLPVCEACRTTVLYLVNESNKLMRQSVNADGRQDTDRTEGRS